MAHMTIQRSATAASLIAALLLTGQLRAGQTAESASGDTESNTELAKKTIRTLIASSTIRSIAGPPRDHLS
jgi:hypothetical protein